MCRFLIAIFRGRSVRPWWRIFWIASRSSGKKDLYPNQLSGGQQQLVGVARAVAGNPKLILADEPTGNLHSGQAKEIMELFRKLNQQGTTIIQVTHSESNAAFGNRIIQLKDGWIVEDSAVVPGSAGAATVQLVKFCKQEKFGVD